MILKNVHAITLRESPERTDKLGSHLREEGIPWTSFHGINAPKWGIATTNTFEYDNPGTGYKIGSKTVGIHLSHYMLWRHLHGLIHYVRLFDEDPWFTILEDDCHFREGWKLRVSEAIKHLPKDWDVFFLGSCDCAGKPTRHIGGEVYEVKYPFCLHAYMVRERGRTRPNPCGGR